MAMTMRVSKPGYNALTDTNIYDYSLYADSNNILIKEKARGSGKLNARESATISHNLGYAPFYLVYTETAEGTGRYRVNSFYQALGDGWRVTTNTDNLYIVAPGTVGNNLGYKYYLFYDDMY